MVADPFARRTPASRVRPSHRGGKFEVHHEKLGGRKKGTPNALSPLFKNAVIEAAERVGGHRPIVDPSYWGWVIANSSMAIGLTREEIEEPESINHDLRSHAQRFENEAFAKTTAMAVANAMLRQDHEMAYQDVVHWLMYPAVHHPSAFAKHLRATLPSAKYESRKRGLSPPRWRGSSWPPTPEPAGPQLFQRFSKIADQSDQIRPDGQMMNRVQQKSTFEAGYRRCGWRKPRMPKLFSVDRINATRKVANRVGKDGNGEDGMNGYLKWLGAYHPRVFKSLMAKVMLLQEAERNASE
jgi:hypothetical protein